MQMLVQHNENLLIASFNISHEMKIKRP